ncbi:phosphopantetheine-binding protein [Devosia riboflavina]|uniref:phosphopantetheine-binding protein n=1 Tax=Devosia riboflavina TaxID=46914 RepID=UPI00068DDB66|nr:phosphopantetheine-binding protein [Devosia riboflavina]
MSETGTPASTARALPSDDVLREEIIQLIMTERNVEREKLVPEASFRSLGFESLDVVMLLMGVEEKYGVYLPIDGELSTVNTLSELLDLLVARIKTAEPASAATAPKAAAGGAAQ